MNSAFKFGQNSLQVAQLIVKRHPEIKEVLLISHTVGVNWRQKYKSHSQRVKNLLRSFKHTKHIEEKIVSRESFLALSLNTLPRLKPHQVWSIASKVMCRNNKIRHIPMMNFHPEQVSKEAVVKCLRHICKNKSGVLLDSGRFYHYYGSFLIDEEGWLKFMAEFLMPLMIVSPRYIGHCLHFGYCTLRFTSDIKYKTKIPTVIGVL
jgi:hypothetical protein